MQRPDKGLECRSLYDVFGSIPFGLDVNPVEAKWVLVDDAIHTSISASPYSDSSLFGAAVPHGDKHVEYRLLKIVWGLIAQSLE